MSLIYTWSKTFESSSSQRVQECPHFKKKKVQVKSCKSVFAAANVHFAATTFCSYNVQLVAAIAIAFTGTSACSPGDRVTLQ